MIFNITVDKRLDAKKDFDNVVNVIRHLHPSLKCYNSDLLFKDEVNLDIECDYTWFGIENTPDDELWMSFIVFHFFPDDILSSPFPHIKLTEKISESFNCNCLVDNVRQIVAGLDMHDPYWTFAFIDEQWFFADTAGMKLMGPYSDGVNETPDDTLLLLLYKLDLTNPKADLYNYTVLMQNGS